MTSEERMINGMMIYRSCVRIFMVETPPKASCVQRSYSSRSNAIIELLNIVYFILFLMACVTLAVIILIVVEIDLQSFHFIFDQSSEFLNVLRHNPHTFFITVHDSVSFHYFYRTLIIIS